MSGGRIGGIGPSGVPSEPSLEPAQVAPEQAIAPPVPEVTTAPTITIDPGASGPGSGRARTSGFYRADLLQALLVDASRTVSLGDGAGFTRAYHTAAQIETDGRSVKLALEPAASARPGSIEAQIAKRVDHYVQFHTKTASKLERDLTAVDEELRIPDPRTRAVYERRADDLRGRLDAQVDQFRFDLASDMAQVLDQLRGRDAPGSERVRSFLPLWLGQLMPQPATADPGWQF